VSVSDVLNSFGVPESAARDGTRIGLHNAAQLRDLLDIGLPPEQRAQHADALLGGITAHVTAQPPASVPLQVNYVWDVSTPDGSLKVIDLPNDIELQDGGCIMARSTPLHFTCTSFVRAGAPPAGYSGDFNILGTAGAPVPTPVTSSAWNPAASGQPGQCLSTSIAGEGGGDGSPGQQGVPGSPGATGSNGIASQLAAITITGSLNVAGAARNLLVVATQSGPGGQGGDGSPGGPGQPGANGAICDCTGNGGGAAGPGAKGGTGGPAGDGGNGTDAAGNIAVILPSGVSTSVVQVVATPAPPGQPGSPGLGGPGGPPGTPGAAGKNNPAGAPAAPGTTGGPGARGNPGTHTGAAANVTVTSNP